MMNVKTINNLKKIFETDIFLRIFPNNYEIIFITDTIFTFIIRSARICISLVI